MCVCVTEMAFLGHLMAVEDIKLLFQKVKAIDRFLLPKNQKNLRVFLGWLITIAVLFPTAPTLHKISMPSYRPTNQTKI